MIYYIIVGLKLGEDIEVYLGLHCVVFNKLQMDMLLYISLKEKIRSGGFRIYHLNRLF